MNIHFPMPLLLSENPKLMHRRRASGFIPPPSSKYSQSGSVITSKLAHFEVKKYNEKKNIKNID